MAETTSSRSNGDLVGLGLLGLVVTVALAPVLLLSAVVFWFNRGKWRRRELFVVFLASLLATCLIPGPVVGGYAHWVGSFFSHADGSPWRVPVVSFTLLTLVFSTLSLLVSTTAVGTNALAKVTRRQANALDSESVVPSEKERAKSVAPIVPPSSSSIVRIPGKAGSKSGSQFLLGYGKNQVPCYLSVDEMGTHMMVLGTTGSGKTVTLTNLIWGLSNVGWDVLCLDLKEDTQPGGLRDFLHHYAAGHAQPYQELALSSTDGEWWFDPVAGLGRDEMRDTILSLFKFDDQHYQAVSKNLLGQAIALLWNLHRVDPVKYLSPTMRDIANLLQDGNSLAARTREGRAVLKAHWPSYQESDYASLANPTPGEVQQASGFSAKIQGLYVTEAGQRLLTRNGNQKQLDPTRPGITYIGLDSNGKADLTAIVSSAVLQRMNVYVSERNTGSVQGPRKPKVIIIDEAGSVNRDIVISLLERARTAHIAIVLATQSPSAWRSGDQDDWGRITNVVNLAVVMRQQNPEEAELCAEYLGRRQQYTLSQRVDESGLSDVGSAKLSYEYHVHPEEIRDLQAGEAILRSGTTRRVNYVRVLKREPLD